MTHHEQFGNLDPLQFIRIHRSAAMNLERIQQLEALSHGGFEVVLGNGSSCRIRTYRALLEQRLGRLQPSPIQLARGSITA